MDYRAQAYIDEVLSYVSADDRTKQRLAEDLRSHIETAAVGEDMDTVLSHMGDARQLAMDLTDALYDDKSQVVRELVRTRAEMNGFGGYGYWGGYEYKSEATFMGIPLVHVNYSGGRRHGRGRMRVAKGIIAIGDVSIGVLSLGGFALGGICLGGISLGLLSLGGLAFGLFLALGGVAAGYLAFGGVALGIYALGGVAIAQCVATGGAAVGTVAIGDAVSGTHTVLIEEGGGALQEAARVIRMVYPNTSEWLVSLLTLFGGSYGI